MGKTKGASYLVTLTRKRYDHQHSEPAKEQFQVVAAEPVGGFEPVSQVALAGNAADNSAKAAPSKSRQSRRFMALKPLLQALPHARGLPRRRERLVAPGGQRAAFWSDWLRFCEALVASAILSTR